MDCKMKIRTLRTLALAFIAVAMAPLAALARDVDYNNEEISIYVTPGEPTQVRFPGVVGGGVKKKVSSLSLQHNDSDLVIFATEALNDNGEAIIVRLKDGRSYSVRVRRSGDTKQRDDVVRVNDSSSVLSDPNEAEPQSRERKFDYAPPSQVSGLMREMVLVAELGKKSIPGYRVSDSYKGEPVPKDSVP